MASVNNRTNINTFLLLKRTENTENKAKLLEKEIDKLNQNFKQLSNLIYINQYNQTSLLDSIKDYLTTEQGTITLNISDFCKMLNEYSPTSEKTFTLIKSVTIYSSLDNPYFEPIVNPNLKRISINSGFALFHNITDYRNMFKGNSTIEYLDFKNARISMNTISWSLLLKTVNAIDMFKDCINLTKINITHGFFYLLIHNNNSGIYDPNGIVSSDDRVFRNCSEFTIEWEVNVKTGEYEGIVKQATNSEFI